MSSVGGVKNLGSTKWGNVRKITRKAKKLKGGGSHQRIKHRGLRVTVSYWYSGRKVFGQSDIKCFISKIRKEEEDNELERHFTI
jgi:hypothetical protein